MLWDPSLGRYLRAVNVARDAGDRRPGPAFERGLPYPNRRVTRIATTDDTLDASLLGLVRPFGALDGRAARRRALVAGSAARSSIAWLQPSCGWWTSSRTRVPATVEGDDRRRALPRIERFVRSVLAAVRERASG